MPTRQGTWKRQKKKTASIFRPRRLHNIPNVRNAHGPVSDLLSLCLKRVKLSILPLEAFPCSPRSGQRSGVVLRAACQRQAAVGGNRNWTVPTHDPHPAAPVMLHQQSHTHWFGLSEITGIVEHKDTVFCCCPPLPPQHTIAQGLKLFWNPTWKFLVGWMSDFNQCVEIVGLCQRNIWDTFGFSKMIVATVKAASSFSVITPLLKDSVGNGLLFVLTRLPAYSMVWAQRPADTVFRRVRCEKLPVTNLKKLWSHCLSRNLTDWPAMKWPGKVFLRFSIWASLPLLLLFLPYFSLSIWHVGHEEELPHLFH